MLLSLTVNAQFTARTKMAHRPHSAVSRRAPSSQPVSCFVSVTDEAVYDRLRACGVTLQSRFGLLAVAQVPQEQQQQ